MPQGHERGAWTSRLGFVLAAAGSAIGLGNIWKFPYVTGENGGAAFVLVYLLCVAVVGVPLMLAEFTVGRAAHRNPVGAYAQLKPNSLWFLVGAMGVLTGFLILSYYSVVAGWVVGYLVESVTGSLGQVGSAEAMAAHFEEFTSNKPLVIGYHGVIMLLSILIVVRGIKGGIERWSKILMPVLLGLLVVLIARSITLPGAAAGVAFLVKPDFSKLTSEALLVALGHAFFTLSLGMGAMITYGSYLPENYNLERSALLVAGLDTAIALMAGFAIFPAVFAFGLSPAQEEGLLFKTLPNVFLALPAGGLFFASLFFFLVAIAALTSAISLLEVVCAYFIDERGWTRRRAAWVFGCFIFLMGVPCVLWGTWFKYAAHVTANYMLPLGGFLIALFVGYAWGMGPARKEVEKGNPLFVTAPLWGLLLRYMVPFVVGQIMLFVVLEEFGLEHGWLRRGLAWVDGFLIALFVVYSLVVLLRGSAAPEERVGAE